MLNRIQINANLYDHLESFVPDDHIGGYAGYIEDCIAQAYLRMHRPISCLTINSSDHACEYCHSVPNHRNKSYKQIARDSLKPKRKQHRPAEYVICGFYHCADCANNWKKQNAFDCDFWTRRIEFLQNNIVGFADYWQACESKTVIDKSGEVIIKL